MKHSVSTISAALLACLALTSAPAHAQSRVFVAAQGADGNPCTFALPCRTFQHAHDVVAANGEIDVLDPAGYGALTITKSISIQGHDFSGISVPSGNGITIMVGGADKVSLRGLIIDGDGTGSNGIVFNAGRSLVVENMTIRNFVGSGIVFSPSTLSGLVVSDTTVSHNGANGVLVHPTGGPAHQSVFHRVKAYNNVSNGILIDSTAMAGSGEVFVGHVSDCIASDEGSGGSGSTSIGFHVLAPGSTASLRIHRSVAFGNTVGAQSDGLGAFIYASGSDFEDNGLNWSKVNSGTLSSYGDNYTDGASAPSALISRQ